MNQDYINKLILYLTFEDDFLTEEIANVIIRDENFQCSIYVNELLRLKIINVNGDRFSLTAPAIVKVKHLPNEFSGNPYGYFIDEEQKAHEFEVNKKWWESENARLQFLNFPSVEKRAKRSEYYAILALIVSAIAIVLQWICNKSD